MMLRLPALLIAGLLGLLATPSAAEEVVRPKALVELFTSQGCAACPPADALLEDLAKLPGVIALAYHVDYWDYIGWTDTFGAVENSDYQRAYARSTGNGRIFTPQLVVNGSEGIVGSKEAAVREALDAATLRVPVELTLKDGMLSVAVPGHPGSEPAVVWLVTFIDHAEVRIERGENSGATMGYTNIVTSRHMLGMWDPDEGARLTLPLDKLLPRGSNGLAVMVQDEIDDLPALILGAALLRL